MIMCQLKLIPIIIYILNIIYPYNILFLNMIYADKPKKLYNEKSYYTSSL